MEIQIIDWYTPQVARAIMPIATRACMLASGLPALGCFADGIVAVYSVYIHPHAHAVALLARGDAAGKGGADGGGAAYEGVNGE